MKRHTFFHSICCSLLIPPLSAAELVEATFRPQWVPQAQFAGYFVALKKGFYRDEGISLTIRDGGPGIISINNVASGKDTFGMDWLVGGIDMVSKGAPVVLVGQMLQTSGLMLVTKKSSGIHSPKDLSGKTVGTWPGLFAIPPNLLFKKYNVKPNVVTQKFSIKEFIQGKVDVASAMIYNEYHTALNSGLKENQVKIIHYRDHGLNFPEDGIYANVNTVRKNPKLIDSFMKASIRGWKYAFEHKKEAIDIVMQEVRRAKTKSNRSHQEKMLSEIEKLMTFRGVKNMGKLEKASFDFVNSALFKSGKIKRKVKFNRFYKEL